MLLVASLMGCNKKLDIKTDSSLVIPKTVQEFESLLDNVDVMNTTPGLAQLSADEYYIPSLANFNSLFSEITRTAYLWEADIYKGQQQILDWNAPYTQIFYSNSVLDLVEQYGPDHKVGFGRVKGWALFVRAYALYSLLSNFSKAYDPATASTDLGVPLKLNGSVTQITNRASVELCYNQIIADAKSAAEYLQAEIEVDKRNRPSKIAAYALLARVYLSMRRYAESEDYANKALTMHNKLIDYNTLTISNTSSFANNNVETIYYSRQVTLYSQASYSTGALYGVDTAIIKRYTPSDLRKPVYFRLNANGNYAASKGINSAQNYPFTGLATDEMYLIKSECLARRNQVDSSMFWLNNLLVNRHKKAEFIPVSALNKEQALSLVLQERQLGLIWRSLRWTDLKRLNLEGANILLTRKLGGQTHTLQPNSSKYVLPIPDDEIKLSGIQQNLR